MFNSRYSDQNNEQIIENDIDNSQNQTNQMTPTKNVFERPFNTKKNNFNNFETNNRYFVSISESQINSKTKKNEENQEDDIISHPEYILSNSKNKPRTERFYNDTVIIFQRNGNSEKKYNNNLVHFIRPNNNDYNYRYENYNNFIFPFNKNNKIKGRNISKLDGNKPRLAHYSYNPKNQNNEKSDIPLRANEKIINEEIGNTANIFSNRKRNYNILNIKRTYVDKEEPIIIESPSNTKKHTIVYNNKTDNNYSIIKLPKRFYAKSEKKLTLKEKKIIEDKKQKGKDDYFSKNEISYSDRPKYIDAILLIQMAYRNYKKNGKIDFNFIKKYIKFYRAINSIENILKKKF